MGLSASQAKLLSLTSRLSSNELRSQEITQAKMRLADETNDVHEKYTKALNQKNLTYFTYDADGNKTYESLTGASLTTYAPLKNQYGLINSSGRILVSEKDAANYQASNNLDEFLAKYNIEKVPTKEYTEALENWEVEYDNWLNSKDSYTKETEVMNSELYNQFIDAVEMCGCWAGGNKLAFLHIEHIMSKMLDYDTDFTAYPGTSKEATYHKLPGGTGVEGNQGGSISQGNNWSQESEDIMVVVREKIKNNADAPELWQDIVNLYYEAVKAGGSLSIISGTDNGEPAMAQSDIIDEFYDADETDGNDSIVERLKVVLKEKEFDEEAWLEDEPKKEDIPESYEYSDPEKAQWYINLWHRMNGSQQEKAGNSELGDYEGQMSEEKTSVASQQWDILEDGLMNNSKWLQNALEQGVITLERVNYENPYELDTGLTTTSWESIIYTNALDISEETNSDSQIAKAEAEFESKTKMIEAKDKQYENMLKLLDTEHSAMEQEYESIKSVISKNIDRTLKIYSA